MSTTRNLLAVLAIVLLCAGSCAPQPPVPLPGRPTKRSAVAWSAHRAAFTENGTTPGAGACSLTEANSPVSLSLRGKFLAESSFFSALTS